MYQDEEYRGVITMATVRGHKIEADFCTQCKRGIWSLAFESHRDCTGVPVCLAQNGSAKKPIYVYVSGPLTTGQLTKNVREAAEYGSELLEHGYAVYLPHTNVLWEIVRPATYEAWLAHDFLWVAKCDVVFRFPGKSHGGDREVEHATKLGIPVFYELEHLYAAWPVEG